MLDFSVTFLITIGNIIILTLILRKVLFKPITKFMGERAKRVQDSITQAETDKREAKALLVKYQAQMKTAEADADEIIKDAREHAATEANLIIADGKAAAEQMMIAGRKQLEAEQLAAMAKFRAEAAVLVLAASSRLIGRELQSEDNRRYANMLLDELAAQKRNI